MQLLRQGQAAGVLLVAGGLAATPDGNGQDARICDECLDLRLEILAETSPI